MDPNLIIDRLGGTHAVARLFGIKPPSVSGWRHDGIPAARMQYLALARPDVFKAQPKGEASNTNNDS